eukprot:3413272-Pyramimonas_sp.AAC.1
MACAHETQTKWKVKRMRDARGTHAERIQNVDDAYTTRKRNNVHETYTKRERDVYETCTNFFNETHTKRKRSAREM